MRNTVSAQRGFAPRRARGDARHLGYFNQNSGTLALFIRTETFGKHRIFKPCPVHGETKEYLQ